MFFVEGKISKIVIGYAVATFLVFTSVMPVSAADLKFKEDINDGVTVQEAVDQEEVEHPSMGGLERAYENIMNNGASMRAQERLKHHIDTRTVETDVYDEEEVECDPEEEIDCEPEVDKSELEAAIAAAGELEEADYTVESWGVFAEALAAAEAVMADEEATQEEVDNALAELNSAMDALEEVVIEVDKSELEAAIAAAGELEEADYTVESWGVFAEAFAAAEAVMADEEATQEEVDNALAELNSAMDALEEVVIEVDKSELEAAIAAAGELEEADYTVESWGVFASALAAAEAVMADEEATQEEVDNALAELNSAMDALEEVEEDDTSVQIDIYKELLEAFKRLQKSYDKLLDAFNNIFGN